MLDEVRFRLRQAAQPHQRIAHRRQHVSRHIDAFCTQRLIVGDHIAVPLALIERDQAVHAQSRRFPGSLWRRVALDAGCIGQCLIGLGIAMRSIHRLGAGPADHACDAVVIQALAFLLRKPVRMPPHRLGRELRATEVAERERAHRVGASIAWVGMQDPLVDGQGVRVALPAAKLLGLLHRGEGSGGIRHVRRPHFTAVRLGHTCGEQSEAEQRSECACKVRTTALHVIA